MAHRHDEQQRWAREYPGVGNEQRAIGSWETFKIKYTCIAGVPVSTNERDQIKISTSQRLLHLSLSQNLIFSPHMTRITSFGRKRTYLEAGFAEPEPNHYRDTTTNLDSPVREPQPAASPSPNAKPTTSARDRIHSPSPDAQDGESETIAEKRKHRKRHRSKKGKGPLGMSQAFAGKRDAEGSESNSGGASEPKWKKQKPERPRSDGQAKGKGGARRDHGPVDRREERRMKRITEKLQVTTCFACREKGHAAKDCPKAAGSSQTAFRGDDIGMDDPKPNPQTRSAPVVGICYRCGSSKHNLSRCKKPADLENPLPFASCFVCSGKGHLAGSCSKNQNKGVYPNGGCCKICGDTTHLAKDCTVRRNEIAAKAAVGTGTGAGADEDDFMVLKRRTKLVEKEENQEGRWKAVVDASAKAPGRLREDGVSVASVARKKVVVF